MKKGRFSDVQIIAVLKQAESGANKCQERLCRSLEKGTEVMKRILTGLVLGFSLAIWGSVGVGQNREQLKSERISVPFPFSETYFVRDVPEGDVLNIRKNPQTGSKIIGNLQNGDVVFIKRYNATKNWAEISTSVSGAIKGWASKKYIFEIKNYYRSIQDEEEFWPDCFLDRLNVIGFNREQTHFAVETFCDGSGDVDPYADEDNSLRGSLSYINLQTGEIEKIYDTPFVENFGHERSDSDYFYIDRIDRNAIISNVLENLRSTAKEAFEFIQGEAELVAGSSEFGTSAVYWGHKLDNPSLYSEYNVYNTLELIVTESSDPKSSCSNFSLFLNKNKITTVLPNEISDPFEFESDDDCNYLRNYRYSINSVYCSFSRDVCVAVINKTRSEYEHWIHHNFLFVPLLDLPKPFLSHL